MPSSLSAAIASLELQREKLDRAIAALRELDGEHTAPPKKAKMPRAPRPAKATAPAIDDAAVRAALKKGPLTPAEFSERFKLSTYTRRTVLEDLETRKVVVVTGATTNRHVALPGSPAKEAP